MRATSSLIAFALLVGGIASVRADDTGVAVIHDWKRVGNRICFDGHFHDGSGNGRTPKDAMADAVKAWENFTAFEYGSDWASYALAASKTASCERGSSDFSCHISAIPCKGGRRR